jgi:hypothetical protein
MRVISHHLILLNIHNRSTQFYLKLFFSVVESKRNSYSTAIMAVWYQDSHYEQYTSKSIFFDLSLRAQQWPQVYKRLENYVLSWDVKFETRWDLSLTDSAAYIECNLFSDWKLKCKKCKAWPFNLPHVLVRFYTKKFWSKFHYYYDISWRVIK